MKDTKLVSIVIEGQVVSHARFLLTQKQLTVLYNVSDWMERRGDRAYLEINEEPVKEFLPDLKSFLDNLQQKENVPYDMCRAIAEGNTKFKFPEEPDDYDD